jgi:WD40 repeat protein
MVATSLPRNADSVRGVAFAPDGRRIATASRDGTAAVWEPSSSGRRELARVRRADSVWGVAFAPDGRRVATASGDGTPAVWEPSSAL